MKDGPVATAALFGFLSHTLNDLAGRVERLEAHAGDVITNSPRRSELLVVLQDFDVVRQMIEDCARLCTAAAAPDDRGRQHLSRILRLEALRTRLLALDPDQTGGADADRSHAGSGNLDLFGASGHVNEGPRDLRATGEACEKVPPLAEQPQASAGRRLTKRTPGSGESPAGPAGCT